MPQPAAVSTATSTLSAGHVVGARFEIENAVKDDALGSILRAKDQKTKRAISLRILSTALFAKPEAIEALRNELKVAAALMHKNVCSTFGTGVEKSGARFVATEWLEGPSLAEMVAEKSGVGAARSLTESAGIVAQIAEALTAIHGKGTAHGAVRPAVVWPAPKVKLAEVGVSAAVLKAGGAAALGESEAPYVAPEVRSGGAPTPAADVFGLGGLFYALVCGRLPTEDFVPPSQAHPEGSAEADAFLFKCLAQNPAERFASAAEARQALLALAPGSSGAARKDASGSLDIDVSVDDHRRSRFPPAVGAPPPPPGAVPQIGQRVSIHEEFRVSMPAPLPRNSAPLPFDAPAAPVASAQVDLGALISKIGENDAARWMVTKDGLDHGPLSGRELVGLLGKGEVLGDHVLSNMDTGERKKVKEHPDFVEFVEQWRLKKQGMDEAHAIVRSAKVEKASNFAKFMIAGAVVVAVGVIATGFFLSRQAETERAVAAANLADLYERGDVEIEGTAGILDDPPRHGGHRGGHRSGSGGGGGGGGSSYEDAMNEVVDLGSAAGDGASESRLSPGQVAGVMNGHINQLFTCVSAELRNGGSLSRVRLDIAIAGSGSVLGTSVRSGSTDFQRCIASRVAAIHFPSFGAPRMGASYSFSVD